MTGVRTIRINDHEQYSLGDSLGRGAFGTVFRGLNTFSGETVAVKQIKLKKMLETDAQDIMTEIELLKNLNHPNIVKYHCFYKGVDSLYIVLEYCENGSLASICKSFGVFPEHLVAVSTDQVLMGLIYLHDQGVIHRDIKGANILTTKDGTVKLADFGVATNALSDQTVVGSPYWMAPEIIELTGATSASDIWSLGCVIIELLQGRPPYSELDQMAAMFHIVDDEHPPFPDCASQGAKDFLMRCFQKNPNLRTSAKKLRKHNWILNHIKQGSSQKSVSTSSNILDYDGAVTSVQEYNQKVNGPDLTLKASKAGRSATTSKQDKTNTSKQSSKRKPITIQTHVEEDEDDWSKDIEFDPANAKNLRTSPHKFLPIHGLTRPKGKAIPSANWDDDFSGPEPQSRSQATQHAIPRLLTRQSMPTIPSSDGAFKSKDGAPSSLISRRASGRQTLPEDLTIRPASSRLAKTPENASAPTTPRSKTMPNTLNVFKGGHTAAASASADLTPKRVQRISAASSLPGREVTRRSALTLQQFADGNEDYSDIAGEVLPQTPTLTLRTTSSDATKRSWMQDDDTGEDPFAEIEEFEKENLTANVLREQRARAAQQMEQLMRDFQSNLMSKLELLTCARDIQTLLNDHSALKAIFISSHGLLPLLETLETSTEDDLILTVLELINFLCLNDEEVQENISFVGGISSVTKFAYKQYSLDIRIQSAIFVRQMLASSDLNAQIFVSCRGLAILTEFLEEDYYESRTLIMTGIDGVLRIFSLQGKYTPKNDLFRIMARTAVLEPLSLTLHVLVTGERDDDDEEAISSILRIMLAFAQADEYVKQLIATENVLKLLMMDLHLLKGDSLIASLKFIKSISSIPSALGTVAKANAVERLVRLLNLNSVTSTYQEVANHVLATLFNLCRMDRARLSEAASVGLIPILKNIVNNDRPLKDLALPMLCNMAHSKECRRLLWSQKGLDFYLKILADPFWQVNAFEAIVIWYFEEPARVERTLVEDGAVQSITAAFGSVRAAPFESMLDQLQKLLKASQKLSRAIIVPDFMSKLVERLNHPKPTVRANILKVLQSILESCKNRTELLVRYSILDVLKDLGDHDSAVIVRALANSMLKPVEETVSRDSLLGNSRKQRDWVNPSIRSSRDRAGTPIRQRNVS